MRVHNSNVYENYYLNYSSALNRDNIFNTAKAQNVVQENNIEEKPEQTVEKIEEPKNHISKEEAVALMYQYEATQIMKAQVESLFDSEVGEEQDELNLQDFRDVNKALNRMELIKYYQEEERMRIQEEQKHVQLWA